MQDLLKKRRHFARTWLLAGATLLLTACATTTPYGAKGFTGGYKEVQVDPSSYRVSFSGNGYTSRDMVTDYWLYRCAELTLEKGFDMFVIVPKQQPKLGEAPVDDAWRPASANMDDAPHLIKARGRVAVPVYMPPIRITTFSADGVIQMYWSPMPAEVKFGFKAQVMHDLLKPYVDSAGKTPAPTLGELFKKAGVFPAAFI